MATGLTLSNFKAVLFDVDGTLVDSLDALVLGLGDTYERFNGSRPTDAELRAIIGRPLRVQLGMFTDQPLTPEREAEMTAYTLERFEANKHMEREFGPAIDALERCHRSGLSTALVTSKNSIELSLFMERFRGAPYCTATVSASDVANPKPDPEAARLACERLAVRTEEAVMIGDSIFDMRCGRKAGCATIAVLYGSGRKEDLLAEAPDAIMETPDDLLQWIEEGLSIPCPEKR